MAVSWDSSVGTATHYGLDGPGIESRRARFSAFVQTGPGAHPTLYTMGTGSLSRGWRCRGVSLTTHPHLAPRLKKQYSYICTPSSTVTSAFSRMATGGKFVIPLWDYVFYPIRKYWSLSETPRTQRNLLLASRLCMKSRTWKQTVVLKHLEGTVQETARRRPEMNRGG